MNITDVGHMVEGEADKMMEAANRVKENKKSGRVPEGAIENPNDPYQIAELLHRGVHGRRAETGLQDCLRIPAARSHGNRPYPGHAGHDPTV